MFNVEYDRIEHLPDGDHIRILTLAASPDSSEPIHVRLATVNLADEPVYEALSYCWGDATNKLLIFCDGKPFPVTENLESALRHIRLPDEDRVLWIDALCINQNDVSERAHQVNLMREVYRRASRVLVWLGDGTPDSDLVFPLCERMVEHRIDLLRDGGIDVNSSEVLWGANRKKILQEKLALARRRAAEAQDDNTDNQGTNQADDVNDEAKDIEATGDESAAFLRLLSRPWFSRCWVLQEVALAKSATVFCGTKAIDWDVFYVGFALAIILGEGALGGRPEQIHRGGLILMMLMRGNIHYADEATEPMNLLWLLWKVYPMHVTDPRDKVYSLLGLISKDDAILPGLTPDYTISTEECYKRAALVIMSRTKNLDILCTERPLQGTLDSPSWVPDWTLEDQPAPVQLLPDANIDEADEPNVKPFRACSTAVEWEPVTKSGNSNILLLSGYVFDRITELADILTVPDLNHIAINDMKTSTGAFTSVWKAILTGLGSYFDTLIQWEKLALPKRNSQTYPTGEDPETVFAITLCCGNIDPTTALSRFQRWRTRYNGPKRLTFFKKLGMKGGVYNSLIGATGMMTGWGELHDRVYATATEKTLYRRLARTEKGYLAVVPSRSVLGDEITLCQGGNMPFVTRCVDGQGQRLVIGPGYVHGIMYGEGWNGRLAEEMEIV